MNHSEATRKTVSDMWAEGMSQSQIGRAIGISRNAVSGLAKRMNLPKRSSETSTPRGWVAHHIAKDNPPPNPLPKAIGPIGDFPKGDTCRYIAGDVREEWRCCGHEGFPYCPAHHALCRVPGKEHSK